MSKKISELTETIEPQDNDVLAIVNGNETKKVKLASIIAKIKTAFNSVYASITHTHTKSEITDFPSLSNVATSGSYNDLKDKPSTFTPSTHNHTKSEITDFPTLSSVATSGSYNDLNNVPSTFTPSTHTHTKSQITDFPTIPTKTSQLTNDSDFTTNAYVNGLVGNVEAVLETITTGSGV